MIALCVDDEPLMLRGLVRKVEGSPDIKEASGFIDGKEALEWAKDHAVDIAFLDIQLREMTGIALAKRLKEIHPQISVIFCTGYQDYALEAMQIHANGYLVKPFAAADVQREIDHLKMAKTLLQNQILESIKEEQDEVSNTGKCLQIRCFGNFEAFSREGVLTFRRKKTKELLAYLIDRRGTMINAGELCAVLWPENYDEHGNVRYLMQLVIDLRESLKQAGASEVLINERRKGYAIDCEKVDCDYYRYLEGEEEALHLFHGEYMKQYDWAEDVTAELGRNTGRKE